MCGGQCVVSSACQELPEAGGTRAASFAGHHTTLQPLTAARFLAKGNAATAGMRKIFPFVYAKKRLIGSAARAREGAFEEPCQHTHAAKGLGT